jgi:hypothetical protein
VFLETLWCVWWIEETKTRYLLPELVVGVLQLEEVPEHPTGLRQAKSLQTRRLETQNSLMWAGLQVALEVAVP